MWRGAVAWITIFQFSGIGLLFGWIYHDKHEMQSGDSVGFDWMCFGLAPLIGALIGLAFAAYQDRQYMRSISKPQKEKHTSNS